MKRLYHPVMLAVLQGKSFVAGRDKGIAAVMLRCRLAFTDINALGKKALPTLQGFVKVNFFDKKALVG